MRFILLTLLPFIILSGCSSGANDISLENYASELPGSIKNGLNITRYISLTKGKAPDVRISLHYNDLMKKWKYESDPPNYDHFINVESVFKTGNFRGDCEDFSATIMAICGGLNLTCQIALGVKNSRGHAWPELLIHHSKPSRAILARIHVLFGNSVSYVYRSDGTWLQLSPEGTLSNYKTQYLISAEGSLQQVEIIPGL